MRGGHRNRMVVLTDLLILIWAASDFAEDWGIGLPFLMRCEATHRVSGSTMTRCSRCCDVSESRSGGGTWGQIQTLGYNRRVFGFDLK